MRSGEIGPKYYNGTIHCYWLVNKKVRNEAYLGINMEGWEG